MKKSYLLVPLLFILMLLPSRSDASHAMGVDITYECVNNCTIRIHFKAYRDCFSSINSISANGLNISAGPGCNLPTQIGAWVNVSNIEVTPICPGTVTMCNSNPPYPPGTIRGVEEHYWTGEFDFCSANCSTYNVSWSICCRNAAITSIVSPGSQSLFSGATTINPLRRPCNNSPAFVNPPVPFICENQPYTFNQGARDPDGDSLVYFLGPCFDNANAILPYVTNPQFTPTQPLGPDWIVDMDSLTGDITMIPNSASNTPGSIQVGVLCVYVNEYRNDTLIGQIVRDMQITVIPCPNNILPTTTGISNISGGSASLTDSLRAFTCVNSNLCFDIPLADPDSGQSIVAFWDTILKPLGATFTNANVGGQVDTITGASPVTGRFCWTPTQTGLYQFLVTIQDDACPIIGQNQFTFTIVVSSMNINYSDSVYGCGPADFCATPLSGISPYTFQWSGSGGINGNANNMDSCFTHTFPGPGTYPYTLRVVDSVGCVSLSNDTVIIPNTVVANAGPDQVICSGGTAIIGDSAGGATDEVYNWIPSVGVADPTAAFTSVTLTNTGITPITQQYIVQAFDTVTTCSDIDTVEITINPIPLAQFNLQAQACVGEVVQVTYTGWNSSNATYNWDFGANANQQFVNGQGPHQVFWLTGGQQTVTLTVIENGCTSAVAIDTITVFPNPVALISPVNDQCFSTHNFSFGNAGTYGSNATFQWTFFPGATPSTSTDENPNNVTFNQPGVKFATLQILENGCISNIDTVSFNIFQDPDPSWAYVGGPQCWEGNSYNFNATGVNGGTATYLWAFQDGTPATATITNPTVSFSTPGQKQVTLTVTENGCVSTFTDVVTVLENPVVDAGLPGEFCEGEGGVQLQGGVGGGTAPYYWTWWCDSTNTFCGIDSINDDNPKVNPDTSTWYYVQVTDFNGCTSNIDSVFVTVIPKPVVDAGADISICPDSAPCVNLSPTITGSPGPFRYQWLPATGLSNDTIPNPCARPDTTTIYTLVVTDLGTGCTSDATTTNTLATVTVTVEPLPVAEAGPDRDICLGDTIDLQGFGFNAGPGYQFQWSPLTGLISPSTVQNPLVSPNITTTYYLTVFSNGCPSYADSVTVNVHTLPTADAGPDVEICLGEEAVLDGQAWGDTTSTGQYTYSWSPSIGVIGNTDVEDLVVSPDSNTVYTLVATSVWGCESNPVSTLVEVKPTPIAEAGDNPTICEGTEYQLTGSYYYQQGNDTVMNLSEIYYSWTPGATLTDTTITNPVATPTQSTWYYFSVRTNTCSTTDSVLLTVIPKPVAEVAADTNIICSEDSIGLIATGGLGNASYTWTPSAGLSNPNVFNPMASPNTSTTYTVVVEEGGCTDTAEVNIEVIPQPEAAYMSSLTDGCVDFTVSFIQTASDAIFYIWDFGDGSPVVNEPNPTHTYSSAGTYTVTLTAVNTGGCEDVVSDLVINVIDPAAADYTSTPSWPAVLTLPGSQVQFDDEAPNAISWVWDFGDGTISNEPNPTHTFIQPGEYMVTLTTTNEFGCTSVITHGPYKVEVPGMDIPNVFTPNGDGNNDRFWVTYSGSQPFTLTIYDRWGVEMYSGVDKYEGWDGMNKTTGDAAPEGIYYYTVVVGDREFAGNLTLVR